MYCPNCGKEQLGYQAYCSNCGIRLPLQQGIPGISYAGEIEYAGFWRRLAAFLIDNILIGITLTTIIYVAGLFVGFTLYNDHYYFSALVVVTIFILFLFFIGIHWLYYAIMESSSFQGTLGKMVLGIIVTDSKGNKVSFVRATGRHFSKFLSRIFNIGYLIIAFTDKKQGFHDMIANTLVIVKK